MHWVLFEARSNNLVEEFDSEDEGLQGIHEMLAVNAPGLIDHLVLGAMYAAGEPHDTELPPVLEGETLKARLAEWVRATNYEASREVHERIRQWLAEEGWQVRGVNDPQAIFNIMAMVNADEGVNIFQYGSHHDHITISRHILLNEESRIEFSKLPEEARRDVAWQIHRDVAVMGVELDDLEAHPMEMRYGLSLYFDGLTKNALMQQIFLVLRASALSIRMIANEFRRAERPEAASNLVPPNIIQYPHRSVDAHDEGDTLTVAG